ncbi:hypothetical protein FXO38_07477 [Capsicum annuum]|nr:hypothetical protein FXO38_07477 [Capsicum annuum]KAF3677915.1 hypothetical protein FXO37_04604 [Capsicum annuum]
MWKLRFLIRGKKDIGFWVNWVSVGITRIRIRFDPFPALILSALGLVRLNFARTKEYVVLQAWIDRPEKVKGNVWRTAGIYDAIQLSKIDIPSERNLLYAVLCFWSISSNSFHFNFGMMGPTLLDIVALTGLRPHGEEISAVHYAPKLNFTFSKGENGKRSTNYEEFIETNMKREDITEDEHIYFLIMWLCKYGPISHCSCRGQEASIGSICIVSFVLRL